MLLPPLTVAAPLLVAAFLAATNTWLPRRVCDGISIVTSCGVAAACLALLWRSRDAAIVYWFGGWGPRGNVALGIAFAIDPVGAGLAALSAVLVTAALVFSLRYFDSVGAVFHVLMLAFLAALCGFTLAGDLFNLFVFFELMSAAAVALCGYKSDEPGPLQGAINFGVTNAIGAFLVLTGIALLYGRTGALNLAQVGRAMGAAPDRLLVTAFALIACGFFVKAALVPFHFWLPDAHAVAPTPVSVVFSGVMVEAGLYAVARIYFTIFQGPLGGHAAGIRALLVGAGVLTALVGGAMCFAQRHLKRLLAYSTVSHMGVMVIGLGLLHARAFAGVAIYAVAHGLVKSSLFLCSGILLHRFRSVDEIALLGRGRGRRGIGALFALGGLALAGLPPFGMFTGEASLEAAADAVGYAWVGAVAAAVAILTGGAVLRAAGRIFLGWGPQAEEVPGVGGETTETPETAPAHRRVPWTMVGPAGALLALALLLGSWPGLRGEAELQLARAQNGASYARRVLEGTQQRPPLIEPPEPLADWVPRAIAVAMGAAALAALTLFRKSLPARARGPTRAAAELIGSLRRLHSGHVGDYVAWLALGVAGFGGLCALLLR